jgi:hypothetical protein
MYSTLCTYTRKFAVQRHSGPHPGRKGSHMS